MGNPPLLLDKKPDDGLPISLTTGYLTADLITRSKQGHINGVDFCFDCLFQRYRPVSYTHLDVYKRQVH